MKQIEVSIMGQSYLLGCPEGGEVRLREAVSQVDREMCAIRDSGKLKARERIAVLAALNLAYALHDPAAKTIAPPPVDVDLPAPEYLDNLLARLDNALDQDGHLI
ncbi:MAG: cell division protein ZapA [Burkholderiales bacterium]|nr:cell division protein ZapA [Burkholderiales bacterium]